MLFALPLLALGVGTVVFLAMIILHRRARAAQAMAPAGANLFSANSRLARHPAAWFGHPFIRCQSRSGGIVPR